jgi:hypothetical protein
MGVDIAYMGALWATVGRRAYAMKSRHLAGVVIAALLVTLVVASSVNAAGWNFVGEGGCRDKDGRHGTPMVYRNVHSLETCQSLCSHCSGVEYSSARNVCEVHSMIIRGVSREQNEQAICFRFSR